MTNYNSRIIEYIIPPTISNTIKLLIVSNCINCIIGGCNITSRQYRNTRKLYEGFDIHWY